MKTLYKYWLFTKTAFQSNLEYRGDQIIYTLSYGAMPLVGLAVCIAVLGNNPSFVFSQRDLMLYFLLIIWVDIMTASWSAYFVATAIEKGEFDMYLLKPYSIADYWIGQNLSQKLLRFFIVTPILLLVGWIMNFNLNILSPLTPLFIISLVLSYIITFFITLNIGLLTFWTHDTDFLRTLYYFAFRLFTGILIPFAFLPQSIKQISFFLPFRYLLSFPVEIILGKISGLDLITGFGIQIFWVFIMFYGYKYLYKEGIKIHQSFGN